MKTSQKYHHHYHSNIPLLSKPSTVTTPSTTSNLKLSSSALDTQLPRLNGSSLTKRHRTETACDICRRRKVRCDLQQEGLACRQCIHAGAVCTVTSRPRKRGMRRSVSQLEERLEKMERLLAERLQEKQKSPSPESIDRQQRCDQRKVGSVTELPRPEETINSINDWIYRMCGIDKATSDVLVKIYFAYVYPVFPVVNKVSFLQQYRDQVGSLPSPPLLCAMYGASARYLESHRAFRDGSLPSCWGIAGQHRTAEAWSQQHMNYVKRIHTPCLAIVQSLVVSMQHRSSANSKWNDVWLLNSFAIRMAQDIGLHKHDHSHTLSETDKETRSQLWGLLYILDRWFSAGTGRPLTAFDEDCERIYPEPRNEKSSHQNHHHHQQQQQPQTQSHQQPHPSMAPQSDTLPAINYSKLPLFEAIAQITKVSRILGQIIHGIYTPAGKKQCMTNGSADLVAILEGALAAWRRNLPPFLRITNTDMPNAPSPGDDESVLVLSGIVGMCYYTSLILLHRPFIETTSTPSSQISLQICTNSAIRMVDIIVKLQSKDHLLTSWSFIIYPTFVASLIHVYNADSRNSMVADVARANLLRVLKTLQAFGKLSPLAEKLHTALHCVAEKRHYLPSYGRPAKQPHITTHTDDANTISPSESEHYCNNIVAWLDNVCTPYSNTDTDPFGLYSFVELGLSECHLSKHLHPPPYSLSPGDAKPTLPPLSLHPDRPAQLYDDFLLYGGNSHTLPLTPTPPAANLNFNPGNIFWDLPSGMQLNEWPTYRAGAERTNVVS